MAAQCLRDCSVYLTQLRNHRIGTRYICLDNLTIGKDTGKNAVEELLLALACGTVDKVPAELEVYDLT